MITFQEMLRKLSLFWEKQGCIIHQGYDLEVGAGTFNPATFLRALGPEPYRAAYIEPSRRPSDGRYGTNPIRFQHYFQYQVILKPSPLNIQDLYLQSLEEIGFDLSKHDIRFVHDDWESPTLGAWGLGWEVWMDGMEVTQFTYFQSVGGVDLKPITGEITYGIERLATYLQKVNSTFDLQWNDKLTYGDIYHRNEVEWSHYNFEHASTDMWYRHFEDYEKEATRLLAAKLPIPAYDFVLKASHAFNMLDARGAISVSERTGYITRIRNLACGVAKAYVESREAQNFPLLKRFEDISRMETQIPTLPKELLTKEGKETFLLEIGSEELPAVFVPIGMSGLEKGVKSLLDSEGIPYDKITAFGTPRRLALSVEGLALQKPAQKIEKKGPAVAQAFDEQGQLKAPGEGFFRSLNLPITSLANIQEGKAEGVEIRDVKGTLYLFGTTTLAGKSTAQILTENLPKIILDIEYPKKMRWADLEISSARPLRWVVALLGSDEVNFKVGDIVSGKQSYGHRQLDPKPFAVEHASRYLEILRQHHVIADVKERTASIQKQIDELEKQHDCTIFAREKVIPQVLNLVEWPMLTVAEFDKAYLKAPKEVLVSEMVEHQKYFPVSKADGTLLPLFVITANNTPSDAIRAGNQKVISARLSDGVFLYETDLKLPLESFNDKLKQVTYLKGLGSVADKVSRLKEHAKTLQQILKISSPAKTERAAHLSKADLTSGMVYEFPELQGTMGKYYALAKGEDQEVATAIDEHWMPRGENAPLPSTETGVIVSLSDKLDNLISCFGSNLKPSSSSDPYALRRQVLGLIRILIQGKYHLPLKDVLAQCYAHFPKMQLPQEEVLKDIEAFITNRIRTVFLDYGFSKDEIEASLASGFSDIYDTFSRVEALHRFRKQPAYSKLHEVYKRAKGQLADQKQTAFNPELLQENAEKELDQVLNKLTPALETAMKAGDYDKAYQLIAQLQPPLAKLFDEIKILADDQKVKENRLALLQRVFGWFGQLLDFSKLQG